MASYDPDSGRLPWGDEVDPALASPGRVAPQTLGEESWKWLFLQPLTEAPGVTSDDTRETGGPETARRAPRGSGWPLAGVLVLVLLASLGA